MPFWLGNEAAQAKTLWASDISKVESMLVRRRHRRRISGHESLRRGGIRDTKKLRVPMSGPMRVARDGIGRQGSLLLLTCVGRRRAAYPALRELAAASRPLDGGAELCCRGSALLYIQSRLMSQHISPKSPITEFAFLSCPHDHPDAAWFLRLIFPPCHY